MAFRFPDDVCLAYVREKIYNGAMDEKIRINKYLSEAGFCSRREADSLIQDGRVTVEDHTAEPGEKITADTVVFVDGKPVKRWRRRFYFCFISPGALYAALRSSARRPRSPNI